VTIKRLNYFKGQFLKVKDFKEEQKYHMGVLQRHHKDLHTWGIVHGLTINNYDGRNIDISPGVAIDKEGRFIVVTEKKIIRPPFPGLFFHIVLHYHEKEVDPSGDTGIQGYTRVVEDAKIELTLSAQGSQELILASVEQPDKESLKISSKERRYSGVSFYSGSGTSPEIVGKVFDNEESGIYVDSPWAEFSGRVQVSSLKITGNTILGSSKDDDSIIVNGVIHPRREPDSKLPANRMVGRKLQVTGDIEFQQILSTPGAMVISSGDDMSLVAQKGIFIRKSGSESLSGRLTIDGDLVVGGKIISKTAKQFAIKHPLNKEKKYLVHASLEGPEVAVYYRGESQLADGTATVELPEYFESFTHRENRTVQITAKWEKREPVSGLAAGAISDGKFIVKSIDNKNTGQKFYWEVKAIRSDIEQLEVEPKREVIEETF